MFYSTEDISDVTGTPVPTLKSHIQSRFLILEAERVGTGRAMQWTRRDAFQAAVFAAISAAGGGPRSAMMAWALLADEPDPTQFSLWVANQPGRSVMLAPAGAQPPDTRTHRFAADVHVLLRDLVRHLQTIDARRAITDPTSYPFRTAFAAPDPNASWSIFLADEAGEPDAETVARICDAIEAGSHILVAARSQAALECVVAVAHRMLSATAPVPVH